MATLQEAVAYFLAERDSFIRAIDSCPASNMEDYWRWQGHAEARRVLRESLERQGIDLMAEPRPEATVKAEALAEAVTAARRDAARSFTNHGRCENESIADWLEDHAKAAQR